MNIQLRHCNCRKGIFSSFHVNRQRPKCGKERQSSVLPPCKDDMQEQGYCTVALKIDRKVHIVIIYCSLSLVPLGKQHVYTRSKYPLHEYHGWRSDCEYYCQLLLETSWEGWEGWGRGTYTAFSTFAGRPSCNAFGTLESPVACDTLPVSLLLFVS